MPDAQFKEELIRCFTESGKPHPTPGQLRDVEQALPNHPWARQEFLKSLRQSMSKIRNPGVLKTHTQGFVAAWPSLLERIEVERAKAAEQGRKNAHEERRRQEAQMEQAWDTWRRYRDPDARVLLESYGVSAEELDSSTERAAS